MSGIDVKSIARFGGTGTLDEAVAGFAALADEAPFGLYLTDPTGDCIWANRRWLETAGLTMDEAAGQGWLQGLHPDERATMGQRWYRAAVSEGDWGFDYRFLDRAGEVTWVHGTAGPMRDADGKLIGYVGLNVDVTEHIRTEDDLRASEDLFRALFERSNIGKSITQPSGEIKVNRAFCEMLGSTPEKLENATWQEITHPDDIELTQHEIDRLLSGEADSTRLQKRFLKEDGSVVWADVSSSLQRRPDGRPDYLITALVDITERHRVEQELRASDEMRDVAESVAGVGSWNWDFATQKATWSPGMVRLFQADVADYGGDVTPILAKRVLPEDMPRLEQATALALEKGASGVVPGVEFRIVLDDGTIRILHSEGTTEYDQDGRGIGITGYYQDVTERRETETELKTSQDRYQALVESLTEGVVLQMRDGTIVSMNRAAELILDLEASEGLGETSTSRDWGSIRPDGSDFPGADHPSMVALRTGKPVTGVLMGLKRADGTVCWIRINANPIFREDEKEPYAVSCSFTDVTARRRAEQEARRAHAMLQGAMDQSPAGIAIADAPDGTLRYVNDAALRIRGGDRATIVDGVGIDQYVSSWELFDLDGRPLRDDEPPLARAILFGETVSREFIVRRTDGVDRVVIGNAAPIKDDAGDISAGIVVFSDVTEFKQAEKDLRELTKANDAKTRFLRSMSHELRTPLNSIIGFSAVMLEGMAGPVSDEQHHQLAMINSSGKHLLALINDILDLSRIEAGKVEVRPEPIDVTKLVEEVVATVAPDAEAKCLRLQLVVSDPAPTLSSDPTKVSQILLNLVENAIKFTDSGSVTLRAEQPSRQLVSFSVTDTGPGIAPEERERVFGEFERAADQGPAVEGTGLGLAISRGLAASLGGMLQLEPSAARGSTFRLTLPATPTEV